MSDPQAEIEQLATGIQRLSGLSKLTLEIEIADGQTQEVTYTDQLRAQGQ